MIEWILEGFADMIITVVNWLIVGVATVLGWVVAIFPSSPFSEPLAPPGLVNLGWLAWLIPFTDMIKDTILLATAVLSYYGIRVLARWIKLVRS